MAIGSLPPPSFALSSAAASGRSANLTQVGLAGEGASTALQRRIQWDGRDELKPTGDVRGSGGLTCQCLARMPPMTLSAL